VRKPETLAVRNLGVELSGRLVPCVMSGCFIYVAPASASQLQLEQAVFQLEEFLLRMSKHITPIFSFVCHGVLVLRSRGVECLLAELLYLSLYLLYVFNCTSYTFKFLSRPFINDRTE
jgi:hypothetical protein